MCKPPPPKPSHPSMQKPSRLIAPPYQPTNHKTSPYMPPPPLCVNNKRSHSRSSQSPSHRRLLSTGWDPPRTAPDDRPTPATNPAFQPTLPPLSLPQAKKGRKRKSAPRRSAMCFTASTSTSGRATAVTCFVWHCVLRCWHAVGYVRPWVEDGRGLNELN